MVQYPPVRITRASLLCAPTREFNRILKITRRTGGTGAGARAAHNQRSQFQNIVGDFPSTNIFKPVQILIYGAKHHIWCEASLIAPSHRTCKIWARIDLCGVAWRPPVTQSFRILTKFEKTGFYFRIHTSTHTTFDRRPPRTQKCPIVSGQLMAFDNSILGLFVLLGQ